MRGNAHSENNTNENDDDNKDPKPIKNNEKFETLDGPVVEK